MKAVQDDCKALFGSVNGLDSGYIMKVSYNVTAPGMTELVKPELDTSQSHGNVERRSFSPV